MRGKHMASWHYSSYKWKNQEMENGKDEDRRMQKDTFMQFPV